ncbi:MAG TPA: hypothetical protein VN673_01090 [Clostridia bacterium]|nr:hypothetical protein [Clostridia bacterium]
MTRVVQTAVVILSGVLLSLAIGFASAWALGGAGHGWCSSVWSALVVFVLPMLAVGFLPHSPRALMRITWYVTIGFVAVDIVLVTSSALEGWSGLRRTSQAVPWLLAAWAVVWMVLHLGVVLLWRRAVRISEQAAAPNGGPAEPLGDSGVGGGPPSGAKG